MFKHVPNILTLIRLIFSPLVLPFLVVYLRPYGHLFINCALSLLFIVLNLTDFFDGYLARKYGYETKLGKILDPIADKFLLFSNLVALVAIGRIYFYWAIIFIGREFFVMGLRLIALEHDFSIEVSSLGKLKTTFLTAYIAVMLIHNTSGPLFTMINGIEYGLLIASLSTSLFSAYKYFNVFIRKIAITQ